MNDFMSDLRGIVAQHMAEQPPDKLAALRRAQAAADEGWDAEIAHVLALPLPEVKRLARQTGISTRGLTVKEHFVGVVMQAWLRQVYRDNGYPADGALPPPSR